MEFLNIPLFDDDLWKLLFRFAINLIVVLTLVLACYRRNRGRSSYVFSLLLLNVMIFFLCFTLKKLDLGLGMALGLFAIFGIIRYRTDTIRVKEMTYLFVVVGVAAINALSNSKTSYAELVVSNVLILAAAFLLERWTYSTPQQKRSITYDNIELLAPGKEAELLADIATRTGVVGTHVKVSKVDLPNGTAQVVVYFDAEQDVAGNREL